MGVACWDFGSILISMLPGRLLVPFSFVCVLMLVFLTSWLRMVVV